MENNRPLLEIFTTSFNESKTIISLIEFYSARVPDCVINVQDNMSTDDTELICGKYDNVKFTTFDTGGKMNEHTLIHLRNNSWRNSIAKFIIVCDSDELVDITEHDLKECEENKSWTICKTVGYELFGHENESPIEYYGIRSEGYSKTILFYRDAINVMNFSPGSHNCSPVPNEGFSIIYNPNEVNLYHTKWQNFEYGIKRQNEIKNKGLSQDTIARGWDYHYTLPDAEHIKYFNNGYNKRIRIK